MSGGLEYRPLSSSESSSDAKPWSATTAERASLDVIGLVAICDVSDRPTANTRPHVSMSVMQYLRLSDFSLVRLDMDRGVTTVMHGAEADEPTSWGRPLSEVIEEVMALVRADDPHDPTAHPWVELAEAAERRGISTEPRTLSTLPYEVLLTTKAILTFVS